MAQGEASDTTKRAAITLCVLSVAVGVTGNFFLGFVGVMCGGLHYCNNGSALDLLFMLSFLTSVLGMVHLFSVLSLGTITLFLDPKRVCGLSESMLEGCCRCTVVARMGCEGRTAGGIATSVRLGSVP